MAGMINIIDVNTTVTVSGNSDTLDTSSMGQLSFTAEVSSLTGSGAYVQVELQASDDATNWTIVHDTRRMITNDVQRVSGVRVSSRYYRYVWFVGGTSPSATLKITTTIKDYSPTRTGSMFRYDDLDLTTISNISTTYNALSNTEVGLMILRSSDARGSVTLKVQGSQDGSLWQDLTGDFTMTAGQGISKDFSGNSNKYLRIIVVSAATGSGAATCTALWNSTGGA